MYFVFSTAHALVVSHTLSIFPDSINLTFPYIVLNPRPSPRAPPPPQSNHIPHFSHIHTQVPTPTSASAPPSSSPPAPTSPAPTSRSPRRPSAPARSAARSPLVSPRSLARPCRRSAHLPSRPTSAHPHRRVGCAGNSSASSVGMRCPFTCTTRTESLW